MLHNHLTQARVRFCSSTLNMEPLITSQVSAEINVTVQHESWEPFEKCGHAYSVNGAALNQADPKTDELPPFKPPRFTDCFQHRSWALSICLDGAHLLCSAPSLLSSANSGRVWFILFWKDPFGHIIGPKCEHGVDSGKEACHALAWANATYIIQNDWLTVTDMVAPINLFHKYILVKSDQRD